MPRRLAVALLFVASFLPRSAFASSIEEVLHDFYAAYAGGDVERAATYWTPVAGAKFARANARVPLTRCHRLHWVRVQCIGNDAAMVDAVLSRWTAMPGDREVIETQRSTFTLENTPSGWRIAKQVPVEESLADRLIAAPAGQRPAFIAEIDEAIVHPLVEVLERRAVRFVNRQQLNLAASVRDIVRELAMRSGNDGHFAVAAGIESMRLRRAAQHDVPGSLRLAEQGVELAERTGDPDTIARALLRYGRSLQTSAQATVPDPFVRILALADHVADVTPLAHAATQMAQWSAEQGDHRGDLRYGLLALRYAAYTDEPVPLINAHLNLGGAYMGQGDHELAFSHHEQAYRLALGAGFNTIASNIVSMLAASYAAFGRSDDALRLLDETIAANSGPEVPRDLIAELLLQRGNIRLSVGRLTDAEADLTGAAEAAKGASESRRVNATLLGLANLRLEQGRYADALSLYRQADGTDAPLVGIGPARALRALGRMSEARVALSEQLKSIERERSTGVTAETRQRRLFMEGRVAAYVELADLLIELREPREAFAVAERMKGRVLQDVLAHGRSNLTKEMTERQRAEQQRLEQTIEALNRKLLAGDDVKLREQLRRARLDLHDFNARLHVLHPQLDVPTPEPERRDQLPAGLDATLIEYVVGKERTLVFTLTRGKDGGTDIATSVLPIKREELQRRVRRFVKQIEQRDLTWATASRELYDLLLAPLPRFDAAKQICIVPDDVLWMLPFHALRDRTGNALVQRLPVFYAPALAVLDAATRRPAPDTDDPALAAFASSGELGELPEAEAEARALAELYGDQARIYVGRAAKESTLKSVAWHAQILHVAAHGLLDDRAPMFSAVLLAPGDGDDGLLEAREVAGLDINAKLAILSACDSGRGKIGGGEGVIGMSWALLAAGCPTAVVSQWKAASAPAAELMVALHRRLIAGDSAAEALRSAQLKLMKDPKRAHPFYWAPFVVVGAP